MKITDRFWRYIAGKAARHWKVDVQEYEFELGISGDVADPYYLDAYSISTWVFRCVNVIAQECAKVPLRFYNEKGELVEKGDLIDVMSRVNPYDASYNLRYQIPGFLGINGNCYLSYEKEAKELYVLHPDRMTIIPGKGDEKINGYIYETNGKKEGYAPDEMIHFKTFNPYNEYYGLSALKVAMTPLTTDIHAQRWNKNFFKNSAIPRGALVTDQELEDQQANRLRKQWEKVYKGTDKAHRIAVLGKGAKWQDVMKSMKDMEFVTLRKMNREEIIAGYGVPPVLLGIFEYANYANSTQQLKIFYEHTVIPMLKLLESVYDEQLIPKIQKGLYAKHDLSDIDVLKENQLVKAKTAETLSKTVMTVNEVRELLYDKEPVEWGDEPIRQAPAGGGLTGLAVKPPDSAIPVLNMPILKDEKAMSQEDIVLWQIQEKKLARHESTFEKRMQEFFKQQEKRVLKNFDDLMKKSFSKMSEEEIAAVMDLVKEIEELRKNGTTTITEILTASAEENLLDVGVDISFDIKPQVAKWIDAKALKLAGQVNDTTKLKIKKVLIQGVEEGQTVEDMRKGIQGIFERAQGTTIKPGRARTIARTESNSAVSKGTVEGWKESEVVESKVWLTAPGAENPRHEMVPGLNRQTVGLNDSFNVQGEMLDHPGDPVGSPENTINCRCAVIAKTRE